jgi:anti-sigma factor RsiW
MSSTRDHISSTQLDGYLDNAVSGAERLLIEQHLRACDVCKNAYDGARQIEEALRTLPRERVSRTFTRAVLRMLHLLPQTSLAFRLLEKIAYLFGLMIVVTVMLTVFTATGVIQWGEIPEAHSAAGKAAAGLLSAVSGAADAVAHFVQTFVPFASSKSGGGIVLAAIAAAALIALVDVVLGKRIPQR